MTEEQWQVMYTKEAVSDLKKLSHPVQVQVTKAINKVSINPLPQTEGGYGKPLGNHLTSKLAGFCKIKLKKAGIRVVYKVVKENNIMKIIVISVRDDETVYKIAFDRINS